MASTAHLMINGAEYDLPDGIGADGRKRSDLQAVEVQIKAAIGGETNIISVERDGEPIQLTLVAGHVDSYALWIPENGDGNDRMTALG